MEDIKNRLSQLCEQEGISLSEKQLGQFQRYMELLVEWNQKMNLTAITDPEGVTVKHFYDSHGDFAFDGCHSLEKINMSNNLINIGEGAFNECSSLIEVELGSSIKDIGKFAFANCNNLNKFTINSRDVSICEDIFITNESNLPKN